MYYIISYYIIYLSIYIYIHGNGKSLMNGGFNGKILNGGFPLSRLTSGAIYVPAACSGKS